MLQKNIRGWKEIQSQQVRQNRNPNELKKQHPEEKEVTRENWKSRWQTNDTSDLKLWSVCLIYLLIHWRFVMSVSNAQNQPKKTKQQKLQWNEKLFFLAIYNYKPRDQHVTSAVFHKNNTAVFFIFLTEVEMLHRHLYDTVSWPFDL